MKNYLILINLMFIITWSACSKDKQDDSNLLMGKYIVLEGINPDHRYVEITESEFTILTLFGIYNAKARRDLPLEIISENEINLLSVTYNYSWENEKLVIREDNGTVTYKLIKDSDVPDPDAWSKPIVVTKLLDVPAFSSSRINDLTYYNGEVITDGHQDLIGDYVVSRIDMNSLTVTQTPVPAASISTLGYTNNIEYTGNGEFWMFDVGSAENRMYKYAVSDLTFLGSVMIPKVFDQSIYHLASDQDRIFGSFYSYVAELDLDVDEWDDRRELALNATDGLEIANGYLYLASNERIYQFSLTDFTCIKSYYMPYQVGSYSLKGITYVQDNTFVAVIRNGNTSEQEIVSLTLD